MTTPAHLRAAGPDVAAAGRQILASQLRTELRLASRQGEQLLVSIGIPWLLLVFFSLVDVLPVPDGIAEPVDFLAPGILALAVMSTAMVSLGIGTGFERQYGVLKRLGVSPLGRGRLILAKVLLVLLMEAAQLVVLGGTALVLGWRPGGSALLAIPAVLAGTAAFAGLGLLMAGTLRATLTLALANGLYLVLLLLGGMIIPLESLPGPLEAFARVLPAAALSDILFNTLSLGAAAPASTWAVLLIWAVVAPLGATMLFRWE